MKEGAGHETILCACVQRIYFCVKSATVSVAMQASVLIIFCLLSDLLIQLNTLLHFS